MKKYVLVLSVALAGVASYAYASKKSSEKEASHNVQIAVCNGGEIFRNYDVARKAEEGLFKRRRDLELYLQTQQNRRNALIEQINAENAKMEAFAKDTGDTNKAAKDEIVANIDAVSKQIRELDQDTITHRNFEMNGLQEEGQRTQQLIVERMKEAAEVAAKECGADIVLDVNSALYVGGHVKNLSERISEVLKQESEDEGASEAKEDKQKTEDKEAKS